MTLLKVKAWFYRLTGIYLAHREENEYTESEEFWEAFRDLLKEDNHNRLGVQAIYGILVGRWQSVNGFVRPFRLKDYD